MWGEIFQFPNFNDATVEVWERKSNFTQHLAGMRLSIPAGIQANPYK